MKYFFALALLAFLFVQAQTQTICTKGDDSVCIDAYGSGYCCGYFKDGSSVVYLCASRAEIEAAQDELTDEQEAYCSSN